MGAFDSQKYFARRKFWALAGQIYIYDDNNNLLFYVKQKMFKLKEDITVYSDESMSSPVLGIKARQIVDFSAAYDIVDMNTKEKVGALKRKGLKSIIKDEWVLMDKDDNPVAKMSEASTFGAIFTRIIGFLPQKYVVKQQTSDITLMEINQLFTFFTHKFNTEFTEDSQGKIDRRLGIGALILLLLIEGKQN